MIQTEDIWINDKSKNKMYINEMQNHRYMSTYSHTTTKNIFHFIHVKSSLRKKKNKVTIQAEIERHMFNITTIYDHFKFNLHYANSILLFCDWQNEWICVDVVEKKCQKRQINRNMTSKLQMQWNQTLWICSFECVSHKLNIQQSKDKKYRQIAYAILSFQTKYFCERENQSQYRKVINFFYDFLK